MSVYHVPEPEWALFLDRLSGIAQGALANVERVREPGHPGRGSRMARSRPLERLALDSEGRVTVSFTDPAERVALARPVGLRFEQPGEHGAATLNVDAANGERWVVRFEKPVVPGIMDGLP